MNNVKENKLLLIASIVLSFMLASCDTNSRAMAPLIGETSSIPSPSATAMTTEFTPINTQQILLDPMETHCAKIVPVEHFASDVGGVLLTYSKDPYKVYLSDPLDENKSEIHIEADLAAYGVNISPNQALVALSISNADPPSQPTKLRIIDALGNTKKEFTWKSEWGRIASWLDNHRILIAKTADLQQSIYNPESFILLDIDTGEDVEVQATYPDVNYTNYVNWNLINYIYSPDFMQVLYPMSKVGPGYVNYVSLLDLARKNTLATLPVILSETGTPQWSPDGSQVLISGLVSKGGKESSSWRGQDLFTIDTHGNITQLTHFTDYYPGAITIDKYVWSPNGKDIAFWLQTEQMNNPQLVTLNLASGKAINHCIDALPSHAASKPIWSSSNSYLVIEQQESMDVTSQTLLMDVSQNTATQIGEGINVVGWLTREQ
jgi:hypothetical protein